MEVFIEFETKRTSIRSSIHFFFSTKACSSMTSVSPSASEGDSGGRLIWEGTGEEEEVVGRRKAEEERSREGGRGRLGGGWGCFSAAAATDRSSCEFERFFRTRGGKEKTYLVISTEL